MVTKIDLVVAYNPQEAVPGGILLVPVQCESKIDCELQANLGCKVRPFLKTHIHAYMA